MSAYLYKGESHTNYETAYMQTLGMDAEQIESVLRQRDFELSQNVEKRATAYRRESDPLFAEAYRKEAAGDTEGAETARTAGLAAVEKIKQQFPVA